jgi:hypothetical protein
VDDEEFLSDLVAGLLRSFRQMDDRVRETILRLVDSQCGGLRK